MKNKVSKPLLSPTPIINANIFIYIGIVAGLVIWFVDAVIDVVIIGNDESLTESLFFVTGSELWMRVLIVLVLTVVGVYASKTYKKSLDLNILLYKHQFELEELVDTRTEALEQRTKELQKLVNTDPLTEIYNRRKFVEVSSKELSRFLRHKSIFSVLMIDIDNFKKINDEQGHDVGDEVIKKTAQLLTAVLRTTDYCARWGGEEFIILSPETGLEGAASLGAKVVALIADHQFEATGQVTISVGVSTVKKDDNNIDDIIKRADDAMYAAKRAGKNQFKVID